MASTLPPELRDKVYDYAATYIYPDFYSYHGHRQYDIAINSLSVFVFGPGSGVTEEMFMNAVRQRPAEVAQMFGAHMLDQNALRAGLRALM
jgi:hypothetical protein